MATKVLDTNAEIASLHDKVDRLTVILEAQEQRYQALEELQRDMIPLVNHGIKLTIDELAEIGTEFQLEDLLYLMKRLLRSTDLINRMLDQLEALSSLGDEAELLGKQVLSNTIETLDKLEQKGYFNFAQNGMYIMEQIVEEFDEDDVKALGDNIVTILKTVRNMTQPEIMSLANNAVNSIREEGPTKDENISTLALLREMSDPKVRRGLVRMLNLVKSLADQPETPSSSN